MQIAVIGMGPLGIVTATTLAHMGNKVVGVGQKEEFYEPGLDELLRQAIQEEKLSFILPNNYCQPTKESEVIFFTTDVMDLVSDFKFITQGTDKNDHEKKIIVIKSTTRPGTNRELREYLRDQGFRHAVVSSPDFSSRGRMVKDTLYPDRVVLGTLDRWSVPILQLLYKPFLRTDNNSVIIVSPESAEFGKICADAFLATRVALMGEFAQTTVNLPGSSIEEVREVLRNDRRIGRGHLFAGCGLGGPLITNTRMVIDTAEKVAGYCSPILKAVLGTNEGQRQIPIDFLLNHFPEGLLGKTIAIWGLAFRQDTDELSDSPALSLIWQLVTHGAIIQAYDPHATEKVLSLVQEKGLEKKLRLKKRQNDALFGAHALVLTPSAEGFRVFDFQEAKRLMSSKIIIDGRNLYDQEEMARHGFFCYQIGVPLIEPPM